MGDFAGPPQHIRLVKSARVPVVGEALTYLDIASVETLIPLHNNTINVVSAMTPNTLVRARNATNARHGGKRALADFQVTPPLGSSISSFKYYSNRPACARRSKLRRYLEVFDGGGMEKASVTAVRPDVVLTFAICLCLRETISEGLPKPRKSDVAPMIREERSMPCLYMS